MLLHECANLSFPLIKWGNTLVSYIQAKVLRFTAGFYAELRICNRKIRDMFVETRVMLFFSRVLYAKETYCTPAKGSTQQENTASLLDLSEDLLELVVSEQGATLNI